MTAKALRLRKYGGCAFAVSGESKCSLKRFSLVSLSRFSREDFILLLRFNIRSASLVCKDVEVKAVDASMG